jgi:CRISPR-associated protein Cas2
MNTERKIYLVCYDIGDEKRLAKVYQIVKGYGQRVQFSVYRCVMSNVQRAELADRLVDIVKPTEDQVLFVLLGAVDSKTAWRVTAIGRPVEVSDRVARIV